MFATIEVDGVELSLDLPSHSHSDRGASASSESRTVFAAPSNKNQIGKKVQSSSVSVIEETWTNDCRSGRLDSGYFSAVKARTAKTGSGHDLSKVTFSDMNLRNEYKKVSDKKRKRKNKICGNLEGRTSEKTNVYASSEGDLAQIGCIENLAKTPLMCTAVMERVPNYGNYQNNSKFDDDEDSKSQVDRLIERGTLMYMDEENSGLSSEGESDDDSEFDSESDITDVSPLVSSTTSPIGPSPVLPRRTPTSPLALYDNSELSSIFRDKSHSLDMSSSEHQIDSDKSINMDLLLRAVIELENENNVENTSPHAPSNRNKRAFSCPVSLVPPNASSQGYAHPVRDNPHHLHLRKLHSRRKNMSFSNEEVRKIDRENRILLKKILEAHHRSSPTSSPSSSRPHHKLSSHSSTNRRREEEKIRRENMILLRKIQDAKASKVISDPLYSPSSLHNVHKHHSSSVSRPVRPSTSGSCGASMLSLNSSSAGLPHVAMPPSRKETAL